MLYPLVFKILNFTLMFLKFYKEPSGFGNLLFALSCMPFTFSEISVMPLFSFLFLLFSVLFLSCFFFSMTLQVLCLACRLLSAVKHHRLLAMSIHQPSICGRLYLATIRWLSNRLSAISLSD